MCAPGCDPAPGPGGPGADLRCTPPPSPAHVGDLVFRKLKNSPTQMCPLDTYEQLICQFSFEVFPPGNQGGSFFSKRKRARAHRTAGLAAQNEVRHVQVAPFRTFDIFSIYPVHLGQHGCPHARTGRPPTLSTEERSPQRRSCAASADVAPLEHHGAM